MQARAACPSPGEAQLSKCANGSNGERLCSMDGAHRLCARVPYAPPRAASNSAAARARSARSHAPPPGPGASARLQSAPTSGAPIATAAAPAASHAAASSGRMPPEASTCVPANGPRLSRQRRVAGPAGPAGNSFTARAPARAAAAISLGVSAPGMASAPARAHASTSPSGCTGDVTNRAPAAIAGAASRASMTVAAPSSTRGGRVADSSYPRRTPSRASGRGAWPPVYPRRGVVVCSCAAAESCCGMVSLEGAVREGGGGGGGGGGGLQGADLQHT